MKLSQEQMKFIKELSNEMKTIDNQDYGFLLLEELEILDIDEHSDNKLVSKDEYSNEKVVSVTDDDIECFYHEWSFNGLHNELLSRLTEYDQINEVKVIDDFYELIDWLKHNFVEGFEIKNYKVEKKVKSNFFLTEKACRDYIDVNKNSLNNPSCYVSSLNRNKEMKKLYEIIHYLADQIKE